MRKGILVAGLTIIAAVAIVDRQFAACEVANIELRDDLQDLAAQVGTKIGLDPERTDAQLRAMVVRRAEDYDIGLKPEQVTVQRTGSDAREVMRLAVDTRRSCETDGIFVHAAFLAFEQQIVLPRPSGRSPRIPGNRLYGLLRPFVIQVSVYGRIIS
jgi:hypothetical protein